jgi:hypothetical protein
MDKAVGDLLIFVDLSPLSFVSTHKRKQYEQDGPEPSPKEEEEHETRVAPWSQAPGKNPGTGRNWPWSHLV